MIEHNTATHLLEALQKEYALYQQLLALSEEQVELMEKDRQDIERIAALMDQKVQITSEIEALEDVHSAIKLNWEQSFESYPDGERKAVKIMRDQITNTMESLLSLEQKVMEFLQSAEKEVSKELQSIYKSRSVNRAYFNLEKHPPKYINRFSK